MARPTRWDILGLDGDPTPGVVESVNALAKEFHDFADDVERAWRGVNSFGADTTALSWVGQSADAFKSTFGPLPGRLQKLYTSYREAGDALAAYAPKLQAAQSKADTALSQAQDAHAAVQRATTAADTAATDLKDAQTKSGADPNSVQTAQTAHDTAQKNLSDAKGHLDALATTARHAHDDRIAAAKECAKALHHASSDGIHNKHWWEHVGEFLSEWGGKIAEVAGEIAPILDVIALATSWIPGVDVVTAALAEADNLVALAGTAMQIAGDTMQGHFGDALLSAGMLGLSYVGGRALGSLGKEAEGESGALGNALGKGPENNLTNPESELGGKGLNVDGTENSSIAGDPVDLVTGYMIDNATDLSLPGILPLALKRTYASGYTTGRLFGPGWSATIDQRVSVNAAGIHFAGDDGQILHYPVPAGQSVLPENGARWPLVWDLDTDEIRVTDPSDGTTRHFAVVHFGDEVGQIRDLTSITDRNGNRVDIHRDEFGTPTGVEHSGGYRVAVDTAATAAGPRVVRLRLLDGSREGLGTGVLEYRYDERGRLVGIVDATGIPHRYDYDAQDRITAWTDRLGYRYEYEYDDLGRVVRSAGMDGALSATFAYDRPNRRTVVTNSLGDTAEYLYDDHGRVVRITNPLGDFESFEHDRYGRTLVRADASGQITRFDRDERGNVVRVVLPDGAVTTAVYSALDQPTEIVEPDGSVWHYEYDDQGNLTAVVDPCGSRTVYAFGPHGHLSSVTDPLGRVTVVETDGAGLPLSVTDPAGSRTSLLRDAFGRVVEVSDPLARVTRTGWTAQGRVAWREDTAGVRRSWAYDHAGNLVAATDALGGVTRFEYGPFGKAVARTDPSGTRYAFGHDSELRLTGVTDPAGNSWTYTFDGAGNLVRETDFAGRTVQYRHDANRRLVARAVAGDVVITMTRDAVGRVLRRESPDGVTAYSYDANGRLAAVRAPSSAVEFTRDALGRIVAEDVDGRTTGFEFDAAGFRVGRTTPSGASSRWAYDAAGRPSELAAGSGSLGFAYDARGRELARTLGPAARLVREFDEADRLVRQQVWVDAADRPVAERDYRYNSNGAPTQLTDAVDGRRRFRTDPTGRITAVEAATWSESYAYDGQGNLTGAETPGATDTAGEREHSANAVRRAGRVHYDHDAAGRLVRTVRRTLSGQRLTTSYAWDAEDRLVEVALPDGTVWCYQYDALGRRTAKLRLGPDGIAERVAFAWDGTRVAEQESVSADGRVTVLTWDYEPGTWRAAAQRRRSWAAEAPQEQIDEVFHAVVTDLVGTPTELVTPDGRVAWRITLRLFGEPLAEASAGGDGCPLRFPGQYHDAETGLHYNLHRYYDPAVAAYLSPDPLGLGPAPNDRGYVGNPLVWIDPLGLYPQDKYPPMSPAFKDDPYHPNEVDKRIAANDDLYPGLIRPEPPPTEPTMIGQNGTQITSQTAWNEGPYRIDVENPNPGVRPGQMHFQDQSNKEAKYYWDHENGGFQGMPQKLADRLAGNRGYNAGIRKGLDWLGESQ